MKSGVYWIRNLATGMKYIGGTENFHRRWVSHLAALRRGDHKCRNLQLAWQNGSPHDFVFEVLEFCSRVREVLDRHEQFWLDLFLPELYNTNPMASCSNIASYNGRTMKAESHQKQSKTLKARWESDLAFRKRGLKTLLSPKRRALVKAASRKYWKDPESKRIASERMKEVWAKRKRAIV